ncbi:hypothetical protein [Herbaspirillum sp. ST 5-3]|uniref:hypothetical protein n=1 Tax=Oxalobacteraceae TaxID=75682 RepID=UPI0010A37A5D|nr:hypothetical protein [Herbaspirillum sp. ST 5-3]
MSPRYWMVLRDPPLSNGKVGLSHAPRFIHETRESAEQEAERLACTHNESFLILEGVAWVHPKPSAGVPGLPLMVPQYERFGD